MEIEERKDYEQYKKELRSLAQSIIRKDLESRSLDEVFNVSDLKEAIFELQIHQIELDLQNEELRRTQNELARAREKYFNFFDLSPLPSFTLDEEGNVIDSNIACAEMLGEEREILANAPFATFVVREHQNAAFEHRKQVYITGKMQELIVSLHGKEGRTITVKMVSKLIDETFGVKKCFSSFIPIDDIINATAPTFLPDND